MLADKKGYSWISTGEIMRATLNKQRSQEIQKGKLINDDEVIKIINKVLHSINKQQEYILDGFPRTVPQTQWLTQQVKAKRLSITAVFNLYISKKVAENRLLKRGRPDDNQAAIKNRLNEYNNVTLPIIDIFKKNKVLVFDIDADQLPEKVNQDIITQLDRIV